MRRIYYENAVYHITARGNNRRNILEESSEKEIFLKVVAKYQKRFSFKIYAYVLMDNHFHMLVECHRLHNISKVMQPILLAYSCHYRNRHNYIGHVWQGRFNSKVIEGENYIVECINYIHFNPVKAKMINDAASYGWSSAKIYDGKIENDGIVNVIKSDQYTSSVTH